MIRDQYSSLHNDTMFEYEGKDNNIGFDYQLKSPCSLNHTSETSEAKKEDDDLQQRLVVIFGNAQ